MYRIWIKRAVFLYCLSRVKFQLPPSLTAFIIEPVNLFSASGAEPRADAVDRRAAAAAAEREQNAGKNSMGESSSRE